MKQFLRNKFHSYKNSRSGKQQHEILKGVYNKYRAFTMIEQDAYVENLLLANKIINLEGDVVECGVWRGGMSAGIAEILGDKRKYYLFDSFEGLPEPKEIDGIAAINWKNDKEGPFYYENCKAEIEFAENAMNKAGVDFTCIKGWFDQTLPSFAGTNQIALLRLDADWYDSTMTCLNYLYPLVKTGGMIILDDYYTWDGCSRAVHDYFSQIKSVSRISNSTKGICYIIKAD